MLLKYNSINRANYYKYLYFNKKLLNINTNIKLQFKIITNNASTNTNIPINNTPTNNTPTNNNTTNNTPTNNTSTNNTPTNNNYKKQFINNLKKIEMHESHSIKPFYI
tara:strand:- start:119 stop:442 length:324 start_codon:yes stop_codon:yes gene_type:complete